MKTEMIRTPTFTFSAKLQRFSRSDLKDDGGKIGDLVAAFPREVIVLFT